MAHLAFIKKAGLSLFLAAAMLACSSPSNQENLNGSSEDAALLLQYLEENGDIVNHPSAPFFIDAPRSEEHTSELQSRPHLVCRLLLEKKKKASRLCFAEPLSS